MTGLTSPPYTDEDARIAVDGSDVAVAEANSANTADVATNADNADQLGGQNPSFFETPNNTSTAGRAGGYVQSGGTATFYLTDGNGQTDTFGGFGDFADQVRIDGSTTNPARVEKIEVDDGNGFDTIFNDQRSVDGGFTENFNFSLRYVEGVRVRISDSFEGNPADGAYETSIHTIGLPNHNHSI